MSSRVVLVAVVLLMWEVKVWIFDFVEVEIEEWGFGFWVDLCD